VTETPALYDELSDWWPLLSAPEEYGSEAAQYLRLMREAVDGTSTKSSSSGAAAGTTPRTSSGTSG
jgi:hypothetical protein